MSSKLHSSNAVQNMGILALIFGIMALIIAVIPCFLAFISVIFGICALIFGAIGFLQAKNNSASTQLPKAGFILGIVAIVINIIWVTSMLGFFKLLDSQQEQVSEKDLIEINALETDTTSKKVNEIIQVE